MFTVKFYYVLNLITQIKSSIIVPVHAVLLFASLMPDGIANNFYFEILIAFIQLFSVGGEVVVEPGQALVLLTETVQATYHRSWLATCTGAFFLKKGCSDQTNRNEECCLLGPNLESKADFHFGAKSFLKPDLQR